MDPDKRARRQSIRVIASEVCMVATVIVTVIILALVVSGYWLNSDFKVERQGLLQISSIPTGADIAIDGATGWMQRTNTSKVLSSGEHTITLTKEGYDSWTRTVNIKEGLLYRVHYPRLFLAEREKETVYNTTSTTFGTVSPNHEYMLLANNTTEWTLLRLSDEKLDPKTIDISGVVSSASLTPSTTKGLFAGEILSANWDYNSEHVLLHIKSGDEAEWIVLDIRNPKNSTNLTKEFHADFSNISILDNSSSNLLTVVNGNLHKIDLNSRQISAVLVENIKYFDHLNSEVVFSAKDSTKEDKPYYIAKTKIDNSDKPEILGEYESAPRIVISRFYEDKYITVLDGQKLTIFKAEDFSEYYSREISYLPESLVVGHEGEFLTVSASDKITSLEMESLDDSTEWSPVSEDYAWLDNDMIYSVSDEGELFVYDFDGLNRRSLSKNVSAHFPVTITNDKWLYYFSDNNLIRELLTR